MINLFYVIFEKMNKSNGSKDCLYDVYDRFWLYLSGHAFLEFPYHNFEQYYFRPLVYWKCLKPKKKNFEYLLLFIYMYLSIYLFTLHTYKYEKITQMRNVQNLGTLHPCNTARLKSYRKRVLRLSEPLIC